MFELIVFVAIITNLFILNNIFSKLSKISQNVDTQKNLLEEIKITENKALEYNPVAQKPNVQEFSAKPVEVVLNQVSKVDSSAVIQPPNSHNSSNGIAKTQDLQNIENPKVQKHESNIIDRSIAWILDGFLIKVGGLLLLLSGGWFLSIGFNNLDANGRITSGLIAGLLLIVIGFWQMKKRIIFGQVLELLGSSIVLIAILSGRFGYNLDWLTPITAFSGCLIIVIINTLISILKNSRPIAFMSLILGYLAPLSALSINYDFVSLMSYVLLFNLGMLCVSYYKKWNFLLLPNMIFSSIYLTVNGLFEPNRFYVWAFAILFMTIFYITTIFNQIKKPQLSKLDFFNSFFATLVGFGWVNLFVDGDWKTVVVALYAILVFLIALILYRQKSPNEFVYLQIITAFISLIYATILLFGNQYDFTLVGISLELTGAQFLVSSILNKKISTQRIVAFLQLIPLFSSVLVLIFGIVSWGNIFTALILTMCAILNSFIFFEKSQTAKQLDFGVLAKIFGLAGFLMTTRWIWIIFEKSFGVDQDRGISSLFLSSNLENLKEATLAHGIALTILTLIAIFLISQLVKFHSSEQKILGYCLIAFVLLRLVLVEITMMDTALKIITFFAIGTLLTLTAFIRKEN